jgi:hypothetical protein
LDAGFFDDILEMKWNFPAFGHGAPNLMLIYSLLFFFFWITLLRENLSFYSNDI